MAESAESMTGYQYAGNNPVMMNDPEGDLLKPPASVMSGKQPEFVFQPTSDAFNGGDPSYDEYSYGGPMGDAFGGFGAAGLDYYFGVTTQTPGTGSGTDSYALDGGNYSSFWSPASGFITDIRDALHDGQQAELSAATLSQGAVFENAVSSGYAFQVYNVEIGSSIFGPLQASLFRGGTPDYASQGGGSFTTPYGIGTYQLDTWSGPYSNSDPTMTYGVQMRIYFTQKGTDFKSFQWIQTYNQYVDGKASSAVDGAADPYYYTQAQLNWSSQFANAFFTDTPASNANARSFIGYTTLIGINPNGSMTPIATFTWGYGSSGVTNVIPVNVSYTFGSGGPNQYLIK